MPPTTRTNDRLNIEFEVDHENNTITRRGFVGFSRYPMNKVLTSCSSYEEAVTRMEHIGCDPEYIFLHTIVTKRKTNQLISNTYEQVIPTEE